MHITIDFETYSEAGFVYNKTTRKWEGLLNASKKGISQVGAAVYAKHPSTRILSLAYKLPDKDIKLWMPSIDTDIPDDLIWYINNIFYNLTNVYFEAWNVGFERWIWEEVAIKRHGFPSIPATKWRCAMAKSRAFALPGSLGECGKVLQTTIQKDKDGIRLLNKFSIPRNPTIKDNRLRIWPVHPRTIATDMDIKDTELLYQYNIQDIQAEIEISQRIPDLSPFELKFWQCDQEINHRGVQIDVVPVLNCIHIIEQAHAKYNAELPILTNGAVNKSSEIGRINKWMASLDINTKSLDEESINDLLKNPLLLPQVRRVLEIRQLIGSAAVKKLYAMLNQCTLDGRLHDLFIYHSARTGRAAGAGVQPQNLPRGEEGFDVDKALEVISTGSLEKVEAAYGNATTAVSNCLRGMFIAKPGHELIASDYSAIEAVVLAELAGEEWRKEVFRTHGKIYEMSASKISGIPFQEILKHKEETGKHHHLRALGKVAELASGYGGWIGAWKAFKADEFLLEDDIKKAILAWREASPAIVEFWGGQNSWQRGSSTIHYHGVEGAAIEAVLYPGTPYYVASNFEIPMIRFEVMDRTLYCTLPSGRRLTYHKPRLEQSTRRPGTYELSYEGWNTNPKNGAPGWIRQSTYGGKLVENITQAVARDILAHAIVNLEEAGYPVVLHVHDEIVAEIPRGTKSLEEFERIMSTMPEWAKDWPIVAKGGWIGQRYCK
jgi:DNA polymerase